MFLLVLHILLVILCIVNAATNKNKLSQILWSLSGLCWLLVSMIEITEMW